VLLHVDLDLVVRVGTLFLLFFFLFFFLLFCLFLLAPALLLFRAFTLFALLPAAERHAAAPRCPPHRKILGVGHGQCRFDFISLGASVSGYSG
jgi:hypothetical protein